MTAAPSVRRRLPDPQTTDAAGRALAETLAPGDRIWLSGPLGAGKSALARATIRALAPPHLANEPMPSPTYTLVQSYETRVGDVLHADLYRLSSAEEAEELGLDDPDAVALIEWADRLGAPADARRLEIALSLEALQVDAGRLLVATGVGGGWGAALSALAQVGEAV